MSFTKQITTTALAATAAAGLWTDRVRAEEPKKTSITTEAGVATGQIQFTGKDLPAFTGSTEWLSSFIDFQETGTRLFLLRSWTQNTTSGEDETLHKAVLIQDISAIEAEIYFTRYWDTGIGELTSHGVTLDTDLSALLEKGFLAENNAHLIFHYIGGPYDPNEIGAKIQLFDEPSLILGVQKAGYDGDFEFNEALIGVEGVNITENWSADLLVRLSENKEHIFFAQRDGVLLQLHGKDIIPNTGINFEGLIYSGFDGKPDRAFAFLSKEFELGDSWEAKIEGGYKGANKFLGEEGEFDHGTYFGVSASRSF